jgi:hypothetical protein
MPATRVIDVLRGLRGRRQQLTRLLARSVGGGDVIDDAGTLAARCAVCRRVVAPTTFQRVVDRGQSYHLPCWDSVSRTRAA